MLPDVDHDYFLCFADGEDPGDQQESQTETEDTEEVPTMSLMELKRAVYDILPEDILAR